MSDNDRKILNLSKEYSVVMANKLIQGKQSLSIRAAKIVRILISQVSMEDKEFYTYKTTVPELAEFLGMDCANLYRDISKICDEILYSRVLVATGDPCNPCISVPWVKKSKYVKNEGVILRLSEEIKPYILALVKCFTTYKIENILKLRSVYSIRLYELLMCQMGISGESKVEIELSEIRDAIRCEDKLLTFNNFRKRVLNPALKEIDQKTDHIVVTTSFKKKGYLVHSVVIDARYVHSSREHTKKVYSAV